MISEIATKLTQSLLMSVQFADKVAGLVVPMRRMVNKIEKVFPVAYNTPSDCDSSVYADLVPDSSKTSIIYCEKIGDVVMEQALRNVWITTATLRLVCWYNLDRINEGQSVDEGNVANNVLSQLPKRLPDAWFLYVRSVILNPVRVIFGADIFSKYTYDEVRTQFLTLPYGAFAIDIEVQYIMNKCAITLGHDLNCNQPEYVKPEEV